MKVVKPQRPPFVVVPPGKVPPKPVKVVTPPTVPAFSEAALVAAVAAMPGATILTVSEDLADKAKMTVLPAIHGKKDTTPAHASIAGLTVRSDHSLSPKTWTVSVS